MKTYTELIHIPDFESRIKYLQLSSTVGAETFGYDRVFNQIFYASPEWNHTRRDIIIRDNGCDLASPGWDILGEPFVVHHIEPITMADIENRSDKLFDPDNLVLTKYSTHRVIHYGFTDKKPFVSEVSR